MGGRAAWFIHRRAQNGSAETFIDPIVNSQLFEREEFIYMHSFRAEPDLTERGIVIGAMRAVKIPASKYGQVLSPIQDYKYIHP
jgi:hypothetical protein